MKNFFLYVSLLFVLTLNGYANENNLEMEEIKAQLKMLTEKVESKNNDDILDVGGRIDLRAISSSLEDRLFAGKIPLDKDSTGERNQLIMSARDSRLWVKANAPSEYGPVRALVEMDFFGTAGNEATTNSHNPRLRHAYVEAAGFTFGQTNSAFNSYVNLDVISFPINHTMVRQPLIRYSINHKSLSYDLSFEQPETTLLDEQGKIIAPKDDLLPDIVARVRYYPSWGESSLAFLSRYITQDHASLSDGSSVSGSSSEVAWGVNFSAKIRAYNLDDIRVDAQYGDGLGRYVSYNAYAAGSIDQDGNIDLQTSYGAHIGYRHWWNKNLKSTLAFSYSGSDNNVGGMSQAVLDNVNKDAYSAQLNLLWTPIVNGLFGVEYAKASRTVESGDKGTTDIFTLLLRYDF